MTLSKYPTLSKALEGNDMAKLQLISYVGDCEKADAIAFIKWLVQDVWKTYDLLKLSADELYLKYLEETSEI